MGFKKANRRFTGVLESAVVRAIGRGRLTKDELLAKVRASPKHGASVAKLTESLRKLLAAGTLVQVGQRARARFRRA
jgi:hypothetical protein